MNPRLTARIDVVIEKRCSWAIDCRPPRTRNEAVGIPSHEALSHGEAGIEQERSRRDEFPLWQIEARHTLADRAQQVGGDGSNAAGDHVCRVNVLSVCSVDGRYIS